MRYSTADDWIKNLMMRIVEMMSEFSVHDPTVFTSMPACMFDEINNNLIEIRKRNTPSNPVKNGKVFGGMNGDTFG